MANSRLTKAFAICLLVVFLALLCRPSGAGLLPNGKFYKSRIGGRETVPQDLPRDEFDERYHPNSVWWLQNIENESPRVCEVCQRELTECKTELEKEIPTPAKPQQGFFSSIWNNLFGRAVDTSNRFKEETKSKILEGKSKLRESSERIAHDVHDRFETVKEGAEKIANEAKHKVKDAAENIKEGTENIIHGAEEKFHNVKDRIETAVEEVTADEPRGPAGILLPLLITFFIGFVVVLRIPSLGYPWLFPHGIPGPIEDEVVLLKDQNAKGRKTTMTTKKNIDDPVLAALERHEPAVAERVRRRA